MKEGLIRNQNSRIVSVLVVITFLVSAFGIMVSFPVDSEEGTLDNTEEAPLRISGEINFNEGDKADQTFHGSARYDYLGYALESGDLDNDGIDDIIIGAYGADEVYIYFGLKNVHPENKGTDANITITASGEALGADLTVGDFNGDGIDDLLIGAPDGNSGRGAAYIYFGKDTWQKKASLKASTTADVTFKGETNPYRYYGLGDQVGKGDIDGDGIDDVVLTDPYFAESYGWPKYLLWGKIYVMWGRSSWNTTYDFDNDQYDVSIYGKPRSTPSGYYVSLYNYMGVGKSSCGDLDGDGDEELVISSGREVYFSSETTNSYSTYAGAIHVLEGTYLNRTKWKKDMSLDDLNDGDSSYPTHHWIYQDSSNGDFGWHPYVGDMNGDGNNDLLCTKSDYSQGTAYIMWGNGSMDRYGGGTWSTRIDIDDISNKTEIGGVHNIYVEDLDGDGFDDLIGGMQRVNNNYNGAVYVWYGQTDWNSQASTGAAALTVYGDTYDYLGYYYATNLQSGDFDNDGQHDLLLGGYYHRSGNNYGEGIAYMLLAEAPDMNVKDVEFLDGDGVDHDIITPEAGGGGYYPNGMYTWKASYNDTWTVVEVQEITLTFELKGEHQGLQYVFGYSTLNETFYVIENIEDSVTLKENYSKFKMLGYNDAEIFFTFIFHMNFLSTEHFDVTFEAKTARNQDSFTLKNTARVEKDLTFDNEDFQVFRGTTPIRRGDYLSGGPPLTVTGLKVVHEGTDVSPLNDKFFIRMKDSYLRVFEDRNSSGKNINFQIPTNVDSGEYKFWIYIIIAPEFQMYAEDRSTIPAFYLTLDFTGPVAPSNLQFHADSTDDPEGRWDDDQHVWVTWDPAFDSQVGIRDYTYTIEGPEGYYITNTTTERILELELGADGLYTMTLRANDNVGNKGLNVMESMVLDTGNVTFHHPTPTYLGDRWINTRSSRVSIRITDIERHVDGPKLDLDSLQYARVDNMETPEEDSDAWRDARYTIVDEDKEGQEHTYTVSIPVENLKEGKNNYIFLRVWDQAENMGIVTPYPIESEDYEDNASKYNPSRLWVDVRPIEFSFDDSVHIDIDDNEASAYIQVNDDLSGVDDSTVQYSVSRNGLNNYGGWITADVESGLAETVSSLLFQPGSTNYVRWRGKDLAGNGYTVSDDYPIIIEPDPVNRPPEVEISTPTMNQVFQTNETNIRFDARESMDPDGDELTFQWVLGDRSVLGNESFMNDIDASDLGSGVHVITIYVSDGKRTVTESVSIYIRVHPDELDTDGDGITDANDDDDDNDGLDDSREALLGTNPRMRDSDLDGLDDSMDEDPLNPEVTRSNDKEDEYSYWDILLLFIALAAFLILISTMLVFKRRSTMEKKRIERSVAAEAKIVQRYETLTGIEAPLLPEVKEMGVSLPPVAAQQVAPVKRAKSLSDTPNLPPTKEGEEEKKEEPKEEAQPAPAPEPVEAPAPVPEPAPKPEPVEKKPTPRRRIRKASTKTDENAPGAVPKPEELTKTAALPGSQDQETPKDDQEQEASNTTCPLCGSTIEVPPGATSVECPLCGEKKDL